MSRLEPHDRGHVKEITIRVLPVTSILMSDCSAILPSASFCLNINWWQNTVRSKGTSSHWLSDKITAPNGSSKVFYEIYSTRHGEGYQLRLRASMCACGTHFPVVNLRLLLVGRSCAFAPSSGMSNAKQQSCKPSSVLKGVAHNTSRHRATWQQPCSGAAVAYTLSKKDVHLCSSSQIHKSIKQVPVSVRNIYWLLAPSALHFTKQPPRTLCRSTFPSSHALRK